MIEGGDDDSIGDMGGFALANTVGIFPCLVAVEKRQATCMHAMEMFCFRSIWIV